MRTGCRGFSLIELMIVLAIVSVLAAIGYPAYLDQVRKGNRAETQGQILDLATSLEDWRSRRFSYEGATLGALAPQLAASPRYNVSLTLINNNQGYQILAVPVGDQAGDGALKIDHQNRTCRDPNSDSNCDLANTSLAWGH